MSWQVLVSPRVKLFHMLLLQIHPSFMCPCAQFSDHDLRLSELRSLQAACQDEAGHLRAVLQAKETDLSHTITALQVAAAQVGVAGF